MHATAELLIDGRWMPASQGLEVPSLDPANGSQIGCFSAATRADAEAAISAARRAFEKPTWAQSPRLRQNVMNEWASRLEHKAEALAQLLTQENGKVIAQSRGELMGAISEIRYYAGLARHIPGHVLEVEPGVFSTMLKEPAGVAGITPVSPKRGAFQPAWLNSALPGASEAPMTTASRQRGSSVLRTWMRMAWAARSYSAASPRA